MKIKGKIDANFVKKVHLVGIGGCGMSAIAKILHEMDFKVSGSDLKESSNTIRLKDLGVKVFIDHNPSFVREADLLVVSSAVPDDNTEIKEAMSRGIPVVKRAEMLAWIMRQFKTKIAVAGTHGKTTTTSMISRILQEGKKDPTFLIGGETDYIDGNARLGKGDYVVAEADESDGSFLNFEPDISVITNIELDHVEFFETEENLVKIFEKYIGNLNKDGLLVLGIDSPICRQIIKKNNLKKTTYGFSQDADIRATDLSFETFSSRFNVYYKDRKLGEVKLSIPGEQNVLNSLAGIIVGLEAGISFSNICSSLHSFEGARRRFQKIGEIGEIILIDDYAHHPTEVKFTLQAAKLGWGKEKRIICVFQPHRYSRTYYLAKDFANAFQDADTVILTDIYSAGEKPIFKIDGKYLLKEVETVREAAYIPKKEKIAEYLENIVQPKDLVIFLGAGDIHTVGKELFHRLKLKLKNDQA